MRVNVIESFIKQYEKEYDFYKEIAKIAHEILESDIIKRGIKAIVSSRAKKVDRLREKLLKRNEREKYKNKSAIEKDIVDLAGLRIALYFPSDREIVGNLIEDLFEIVAVKKFPEDVYEPKFNKRFSGYWATHYRVKLKSSDEIDKRFTNIILEIQVASVLMHAWSEVEHDLVYKPFSGTLTDDELAILDEINGLVLTGEIALERLQKAITERTKKQNEITDKYDLTNYINYSYQNNFKNIDLGNTEFLNNYLKANNNKISTSQLSQAIKRITTNSNESFSDQVLQNIISINTSGKSLQRYLQQFSLDENKVSSFELFVKTWIIFEKVIKQLMEENSIDKENQQVNFFTNIEQIFEVAELSKDDKNNILLLRRIRNQMLHGVESFSDRDLEKYYKLLKEIVIKCINKIKTKKVAERLQKELNY
ncbi:GTP pyrophosphokinase family protein [Epilithonimonas zeae]|uniref:PpGpp synthetase catalytic domain-containing protein (RelA/SpoT-type nucleotidyltranferase) n=1 Tax=Epilithonimonas zeae TaxID=1416779 RepID=A0A1N6FWI8_9FLAO|nr:RelA/SpoT domain-containing protein [Epilithonimonas zeae]SIN99587.1 ppGpp synthetase catalytic domain-containing protein (RelA/SpoT-type nucleotidyltranferase) [Epilithonimonas zeae]